MKSVQLRIPSIKVEKDLTIIYKKGKNELHELKTSKDELLKTLRYFKLKSNEINQMHLIYIQEDIEYDIFENFISSISTKIIDINDSNYESYYYLSCKYEYNELRDEIEEFIQKNLNDSVVHDLIQQSNDPLKNEQYPILNPLKEELIAKNLDYSIKSGLLKKLSIQIINRVLNSPKRVIKNHHLLFSFIIDLLRNKTKEPLKNEEGEYLAFLPSSLDFGEMNNDEILELFEIIEKSGDFFKPRNPETKMKNLILNEKEIMKKNDELQSRINEIESNYSKKFENLEMQMKNMEKKFKEFYENQNENIEKRISNIEDIQKKSFENQASIIEKQDERIQLIEKEI